MSVEGAAQSFLSWLVDTAWLGGLALLVVLLVNLTVGRWLRPAVRHALWLIALARFALPAVPAFEWSPHGITLPAANLVEDSAAGVAAPDRGRVSTAPALVAPVVLSGRSPAGGADVRAAAAPERLSDRSRATERDRPAKVAASSGSGLRTLLLLLWGSGASVLAVRSMLALLSARRVLRSARPADESIQRAMESAARRLRLRHAPKVVVVDRGVATPAITGVLFPRVVLPSAILRTLPERELRLVLLHELVHVRRRDVLVDRALALVRIVHWFHPLVWLASARVRAERELACDERVLGLGNREDALRYGRTLLALAGAAPVPAGRRPVLVSMAASARSIRRRIRMIARFDRRPPRRAALATIVMLCVAFVGWTRGADPAPGQSKDAPGPKDPGTLLSIYDVGDLVGTPAFAPPRLGLSLPADDERREEAESRERLVAERRVLELVQLLQGEVESAGHANARIEPLEGRQIVVDAPPDVHDRIGRILVDLRGGDVDIVSLEFRVLRLTGALLEELSPDLARTLRFAAFSRAPGGAGRLSEESVETLTRFGVDDESTFAPLLTALSRQRCHLLVVTQAAKIAGVKTVVEGGVATGKPLIGILNTGIVVEVEPTVSEDHRSVSLALAVDTAHEGGPGDVVAVKDLPEYEGLAGIEEMFVQKPDLVQTRLLTTIRASVGEWTIAGVTTPTDLGRSADESSVVLVKASAKAPGPVPSDGGSEAREVSEPR